MLRMIFTKTGNAVYISHLDLMRLFQRAFQRAGLKLKFSQGFNQRAEVSIALPMSLGTESLCEFLDFELDGCSLPFSEIRDRLNAALLKGVEVLEVYEAKRKIKELTHLQCRVALEYDGGVPMSAETEMAALFARESLLLEKKSKNGMTEQDIIPMIRTLSVYASDGGTLVMDAVVCAQNPTLNPMQLVAAVHKYLPHLSPDFSVITRVEALDCQGNIYR